MRKCLPLLLFFCAALGARAQQSTPKPDQSTPKAPGTAPQSTSSGDKSAGTPAPAPKPDNKRDYAQESFVIEQMHSRYRFEADGTGRKETVARIRVQSEAGVQQWGQLLEGYNSANERVEIPYVRVRTADGTIVKADDSAVQDRSPPIVHEAPVVIDHRQQHITEPGLRPGEVLEDDMG